MKRYDRRARLLAIVLAALAGYVDALGFLGSGGFFVSFMSGNSTRLGVGLSANLVAAGFALALIATFLMGVVAAAIVKRKVKSADQRSAVLTLTATLLTLAALPVWPGRFVGFLPIAAAMGAINLLFEVDGDVRIGLTYMTGTLVKLGHRIGDALTGGDRWAWAPYLALWTGLVTGGGLGGLAFMRFGTAALWGAVLVAWGLSLASVADRRSGVD